jgi:hypothetical protein
VPDGTPVNSPQDRDFKPWEDSIYGLVSQLEGRYLAHGYDPEVLKTIWIRKPLGAALESKDVVVAAREGIALGYTTRFHELKIENGTLWGYVSIHPEATRIRENQIPNKAFYISGWRPRIK